MTRGPHRDDAPEFSTSAHQRRTHALVANQVDGTAHVDVHEVHLVPNCKKGGRELFTKNNRVRP